MIDVKYYCSDMGVEPYRQWFSSIRSVRAKQRVLTAVSKMERGLLGDVKSVGSGVQECRIHFEKGYRIYFGSEGTDVVILLVGSDKSNQDKEIENAQNYWKDYKRQKKERKHEKSK